MTDNVRERVELRETVNSLKTVEGALIAEKNELRALLDSQQRTIEGLRKWIRDKGRHHIACMKLDQYDERDYGCTCGYEAALSQSSQAGE